MRILLGLTLGLVVLAEGASGEASTSGMHRVGYLGSFPPPPGGAPALAAFVDGLRTHGYIEARISRSSIDTRTVSTNAGPDSYVSCFRLTSRSLPPPTRAAAQAVKAHASTIPVVLLGASDPVGTGLAASLARPGGNITGLSSQLGDLEEKSLQLLLEVAPRVSRLAVFWNPENVGSAAALRTLKAHAAVRGMTLHPVVGRTREEMDAALAALARERPDALLVHLWYSASPERTARRVRGTNTHRHHVWLESASSTRAC